jgi:hypothetical protein
MSQEGYIKEFQNNVTHVIPPSVTYRVKFITYDPTHNDWNEKTRFEEIVTLTIVSNGKVKSDLCDFDLVVSTAGISGTWTYDIPAPGSENVKSLPLLTEVSGFESDDCQESTYWTLDVLLPRGGSPGWESVWNSTTDYE